MSDSPSRPARRVRTATSAFGAGKRESHDASGFYERFTPPELSTDDTLGTPAEVDVLHCGDARDMAVVPDGSVALVVTSPPYFVGKEYEADLRSGQVPATYAEYLDLLTGVFAECVRVLEPGGRIAVNVANLGRKPYRSLSADIITILQDRLRLLLRGEIIWWKGRAAGGSCAWGTFAKPANPVMRDVTERVIVASKGRFDRAVPPLERLRAGRPAAATIAVDEFLEATTDLWELLPERASRVGHPAPFPVELPQRLMELHTYAGDVVLDPFMGSGSTAVAAVRTGRRYIGYDTDPSYLAAAQDRVEAERAAATVGAAVGAGAGIDPGARRDGAPAGTHGVPAARERAEEVLLAAGFVDLVRPGRFTRAGVEVTWTGTGPDGRRWALDLAGGFTTSTSGLRRQETLWRTLGKAAALAGLPDPPPLLVLTTQLPTRPGVAALSVVAGPGRPIAGVVDLGDPGAPAQLQHLLAGLPRLA